ncbi:uncharacterized protein METZ01_LOCUS436856, partial [marine metagenome]
STLSDSGMAVRYDGDKKTNVLFVVFG